MPLFKICLALTLWSVSAFAFYADQKEADSLNYEKLQLMISHHHVKTVDGFLAALKTTAPIYLNQHILMFRSRSLQCGSNTAPRTILFGESAKLLLAFNGGGASCGGDSVEVIQFRDDHRQAFEFREITFADGQKPQFSEANPKKCLACHQSANRAEVDPRPNWEPYNTWPGAFGGLSALGVQYSTTILYDDRFGSQSKRDPNDQLLIDEFATEEARFNHFQSLKAKLPRYRHLGVSDPHMPTDFTRFVHKLNDQRLLRQFRSRPDIWQAYGATFVGMMNCSRLFIDEDILQWHKERSGPSWMQTKGLYSQRSMMPREESIREYYQQGLTYDEAQKAMAMVKAMPKDPYPMIALSEGLQWLFEPLGLAYEDIGPDFKTMGRFAFQERFGTPDNPWQEARQALQAFDPELARMSCETLKEKSLNETRSYGQQLRQQLTSSPPQLPAEKPLRETCASCHTERSPGSHVPFIDFLNESTLRAQLKKDIYPHGTLAQEILYRVSEYASSSDQMPPRGVGSTTTPPRQQFARWIESLVTE